MLFRDQLRRAALRIICLCAAAMQVPVGAARAAVVVLANRTKESVALTALADDLPPNRVSLAAGEARPIFAERSIRVRANPPGAAREIPLDLGCAYFVAPGDGAGPLRVARIPLGEPPGRPLPSDGGRTNYLPTAGEITVKILVDDDEYRPRPAWEAEIRQRIDRASAILAAHAGVRLKVVDVGTWDSDDLDSDFFRSLTEFEREVRAAPAQLAIGFSSQYEIQQGRVHMGGTRGPLHSHILVKERARNVLESERLALLVHELGHLLGATHSARPTSIMRPVLGPGQQRAADATIGFDAPNTLLMSMLGEEIRRRGVREYSEVSPTTLRRMGEIYAALEPELPNDPATANFRRLTAAAGVGPIIEDSRKVLAQIVRVAKLHKKQLQESPPASGEANSHGDKLMDLYVRQGALAAKLVRRDTAARALLIALAIAVDDPVQMAKIPIAGTLLTQLEGKQAQTERMAAIGQPTMRGRLDLTRHFFVAAELTVLGGSDFARGSGLAKELSDSQGGSGFSFCDMAANEAGVRFAEAVLGGQLTLDDVAQKFTVEEFFPSISGLREGLQADEFAREFGDTGDPRYNAVMTQIRTRVGALPGYAPVEARKAASP